MAPLVLIDLENECDGTQDRNIVSKEVMEAQAVAKEGTVEKKLPARLDKIAVAVSTRPAVSTPLRAVTPWVGEGSAWTIHKVPCTMSVPRYAWKDVTVQRKKSLFNFKDKRKVCGLLVFISLCEFKGNVSSYGGMSRFASQTKVFEIKLTNELVDNEDSVSEASEEITEKKDEQV